MLKTLAVFLSLLFILNIGFGSTSMSLTALIDSPVLWALRLPSAIICILAGGVLALSGFATQTLFKNSLATPYTLGVASSASLGAILAMSLGLGWSMVSLSALVFSLLSILLLLFAFKTFKFDYLRLLLLGIALNLFSSSLISIIQVMSGKLDLSLFLSWIMGSVSVVGYDSVYILCFAFILLIFVMFKYLRELMIMSVEGHDSFTRGFDPSKVRSILLLTISLSVGLLVSQLGPIGFVGLVIPHLTSRIVVFKGNQLIFGNCMLGGSFILFADLVNRSLLSDYGLPVGVLITVFGAPVLAVFLWKKSI